MQGVLRDEGADTRALLQPGPGREAEMVADIDVRWAFSCAAASISLNVRVTPGSDVLVVENCSPRPGINPSMIAAAVAPALECARGPRLPTRSGFWRMTH